jgi:hypothetical protein
MKKTIPLAVFFTIILLAGCKKDAVFMSTATIVGVDARMTACAGGVYIKIDGQPNPNDPTNGYYDIGSAPSSFHFNDFNKFPIKIKLNWSVNAKCSGNYIDINKVEIVN